MPARGLLACLLLSLALAGCADDSPAAAPADEDFSDLGLQADGTTGIIRGVVVDEAIRPIAGVAIALTGASTASTQTNADGLFGFSRLAPGTYFLSASKPGHVPVQQSVEVAAGQADPPTTRILLAADPETRPYSETYQFEGYIACSASFVAAGLAACSTAGLPNDKFIVEYPIEQPPTWVQSEMHWTSTQAASPELDIVYSRDGDGALLHNWAEDFGPSPLLIQADSALAAANGIGDGTNLLVRVFNQPVQGTEPPCVERPVLGGCTTGVGVTAQQQFTIYTTVFYGYAPPAEWRFAETGPLPPPA